MNEEEFEHNELEFGKEMDVDYFRHRKMGRGWLPILTESVEVIQTEDNAPIYTETRNF